MTPLSTILKRSTQEPVHPESLRLLTDTFFVVVPRPTHPIKGDKQGVGHSAFVLPGCLAK